MSGYNFLSMVGIVVLLLIAFLCSDNRRKIRWRIVGIGILAEIVFAYLFRPNGFCQLIFHRHPDWRYRGDRARPEKGCGQAGF